MSTKIKYGLLIFIFSLIITAALITNAYMPWRAFSEVEKRCTEPVTAKVVDTLKQEEENYFYYGPKVEFPDRRNGYNLRTDLVNTARINKTWQEGEYIAVYYNPADPSEAILRGDHTAENNFHSSIVIGIILSAAGLIVLIVSIVNTYKTPKGKTEKFKTNISGQSFEEWREQQNTEDGEEEQDKTGAEE